jgi:hypothetical protein
MHKRTKKTKPKQYGRKKQYKKFYSKNPKPPKTHIKVDVKLSPIGVESVSKKQWFS